VSKPDGTTTTVQVTAGNAFNPATGQTYPIPTAAGVSLSETVEAMGLKIYTAPTEYAVDNTTVWVSPTAGNETPVGP
jgi:hypothetical protein